MICVSCSVMSDSATSWTVYSQPGSSVHEVLQARILEWVAMLSSRGIFLIQRFNPLLLYLLHLQLGSLPLGPPGKPLLSLRHKEKSQTTASHQPSLLLPPSNPWLPLSLAIALDFQSFSLPPLLPLIIQPSLSRHSRLFKTWIRSHSLAQKFPCSFLS